MGQWASGPESWGPSWDPPRKKKKNLSSYLIKIFFQKYPEILTNYWRKILRKLEKNYKIAKKLSEILRKIF